MLAQFSPLLLSGSEENLVILQKEDNDIAKEGIIHVLAKAGGSIREQLAASSRCNSMTFYSVDLILKRLCLEGSRKQAKYAVHALAVITKDDGLKSLSVLYKRLVDMLENKTHLPAILQSLGYIAQTAMPVFKTRETKILEFITSKILKCSNIFGIKALVKSYLPIKDSHLRLGLANLLEILKIPVDRAHMKLASAKAVLRLSKEWDHKIPIDVFHLTLGTSELHIFTSLIMHGDEDSKSEISTDKESISTLVSIFQSIKRSEDIVDAMKSKEIQGMDFSIFKRPELQKLSMALNLCANQTNVKMANELASYYFKKLNEGRIHEFGEDRASSS
ncbi:hypothetical protein GIB67_005377, partial [Kingdonia uniflora]